MKLRIFLFLSLFFIFTTKVLAGEPLVKYNIYYQTDPVTKLRIPDKSLIDTSNRFRNGGISVLNPNSPMIGDTEDCYPDDPNNPTGNILISGNITSKETNQPITGAVVAVYMGNEHTNNTTEYFGAPERFVIGAGKRLTNLYYYDVTKDGRYTVYACNDYKALSQDKVKRYGSNFCEDGYTKTGSNCTHYDYTKSYPKFYLSVICGMSGFERNNRSSDIKFYLQTKDEARLKPWIGEILSIDNYNEPYKGLNRPDYLAKRNMDLKVSCSNNLAAFPVPMFLDYTTDENVASCRMDDVSPNLVNYFKKIQTPLRSSQYSLASSLVPGSTKVPDINSLNNCLDADNPLCAKNFITKSFPVPDKDKNMFNYGRSTFIQGSTSLVNANPVLRNEVMSYNTVKGLHTRSIDFQAGDYAPGEEDYLAVGMDKTTGQIDAKLDAKTGIDDVKFDLESLKDLYACFTSFNFPVFRSSSSLDEKAFSEANPALSKYFTPNLRIPSCRELYCGGEYVPDGAICNVPTVNETNGFNFGVPQNKKVTQISALSGYGPGVTMTTRSKKEITEELMVLVNELINSDFNPKKDLPGVKYKPVNRISDIIGCVADNGQPVLVAEDGSITYESIKGTKKFWSPVPMISFISIPYNMEYMHAISNDNYKNKPGANGSLYSEECNIGQAGGPNNDKQFANCRSAVIPGGVYSVSALRVIAKMCNDNTRLPMPMKDKYENILDTSRVATGSNDNGNNKGIEVELAATKIGSPVSLCLCDPNSPSAGCNQATKLNSNFKDNFGAASFVGQADQQKNGNNYLGTLCNMNKEDAENNTCNGWISQNAGFNLKGSPNFVGGSSNLRVAWSYSYDRFLARDNTDQYIHYTRTEGNDTSQPSNNNNLPSTNDPLTKDNLNAPGDFGKACKTYDSTGKCTNFYQVVHDIKVQNISSLENPANRPDVTFGSNTNTKQIPMTEFDSATGSGKDDGAFKIFQRTKDGTSGYVYTKYDYVNEKYDPIPELLNEFRKYSIYGIIPAGGSRYCRTPKLATLLDFRTQEYAKNTGTNSPPEKNEGFDMNFSTSSGVFCNEAIPEELDRCDNLPNGADGPDVAPMDKVSRPGYTTADLCKMRKCLSFCNQLYPTYEFYGSPSGFFNDVIQSATSSAFTTVVPTDPSGNPLPQFKGKKVNERVYFCKNSEPKTQNVAMELNKGDEGCVLDYTKKIRDIFVLPAASNPLLSDRQFDPSLDKFNYPIYNNQLCINPVNQLNYNPNNPVLNDQFNCKPYIQAQRPADFR
jgi:hypothetical protein